MTIISINNFNALVNPCLELGRTKGDLDGVLPLHETTVVGSFQTSPI